MATSGQKITKPVAQAADIRPTIKESGVGIIALANSKNVNKWSKAKPVYWYGGTFIHTTNPLDWWMGNDSTNGLPSGLIAGMYVGYNRYMSLWNPAKTPALVTIATNARTLDFSQCTGFLPDLAKGQTGQWVYKTPNACRHVDFDGYVDNAINPLPVVTNQSKTTKTDGSVDIYITVPTQVAGGLTLQDLKPRGAVGTPLSLEDCYLGVFLYNDSLSDCIFVTQTAAQREAQKGGASRWVTLKADANSGFGFAVGSRTYKAKAFFSPGPIKINDRNYDDNGIVVTQDLVMCSDVPGTITIKTEASYPNAVYVDSVWMDYITGSGAGNGTLRVYFTIRNGTSKANTFTGGMVRVRETGGTFDGYGSDIKNLGTIAAGSVTTAYVDIPYTGNSTGYTEFELANYELSGSPVSILEPLGDQKFTLWIY